MDIHLQLMKLEMKETDGVPVTGIPDGSRTDIEKRFNRDCKPQASGLVDQHIKI